MEPRIALPPDFRGRAFLRTDAAAAGLGKQRLNGPDLQAPFRGVRTHDVDLTELRALCGAYAVRMPAQHAFSHTTAALLLGMPLPPPQATATELHVTAPPGQAAPRMRGVIGHHADTSRAVTVSGGAATTPRLPVLPPLTVWCQLATLLELPALVACADYLLGGRRPRATPELLLETVAGWAPRRGSRVLREAALQARVGVDSPKETELRLLLRGCGLPEPLVNRRYYDANSFYLGKADLSWPELWIVLEYEGDQHRSNRAIFRQDLARRERFESAGWSVIRVTDDDLGPGRRAFEQTVRARIRRQARLHGIEITV